MAKDKDNFDQTESFDLDDILAEFGNESRDLPSVTESSATDLGVPQDGPDLIPTEHKTQHPHRIERVKGVEPEPQAQRVAPSADQPDPPLPPNWKDNTIPFSTRPRKPKVKATPPSTPPKGNYIPAGGEPDSVDALVAQVFDGDVPREPTVSEPTRVLDFPAPEPENPLAAGLGRLSRKADEFAAHMYEKEDVDDPKARRAEKLIPAVDEEEQPKKHSRLTRERKPRKEVPPPPDVPPAELAKRYAKGLKALRARTVLVLFLALVSLYLTLAQGFHLPPLTTDPALNCYAIASFHIIALALGYDALLRGLKRPFTGGGLAMDTMAALANLFALIDTLTIPTLGAENLRQSLCGVAALALGCVMLGNLRKQRGQRLCCRAAASAASPYLVTRDEAKWNSRDTYVKWSGPIAGFGSQVQSPDGAERIYRLLTPILLLAALLFSLISSVGRGRAGDFLWCFAALLTAATPLSATLCFGSPWHTLSARLARSGAALAGWQGVTNTTGGSNLLLTDTDLFPGKAVTVNGVKVFGDFPIDMVVADTATVIRDAGSGLEKIFYELLRSQGTLYRTGESLTAYEGGGYSEVIRGQQVLVGSAAFMVLMDVPLPSGLKVKNAVFCAIDGELAGIFALNYHLPGTVPEAIDSLIRNKITPVLATRDFNLIPSMLRQRFKLPVEKMEYPSVERRRELSDPDQEHSDTLSAVLCREGLGPYAEAVVGGRRLRTAVRLSASLACLGSTIGVLLCFYLTFVAAYASLTPLNLLVFVLMWLVPAPLISGWVNRY